MFWNIVLKPRDYKKIEIEGILHITNISLHLTKQDCKTRNQLFVTESKSRIMIASLIPHVSEHAVVDLIFNKTFTLSNNGPSEVHLAGYIVESPKYDNMEEEDDEDDLPHVQFDDDEDDMLQKELEMMNDETVNDLQELTSKGNKKPKKTQNEKKKEGKKAKK